MAWRRSSGWRSVHQSFSVADAAQCKPQRCKMDRRIFMKSGALSLMTMGLSPSFLRRTAFAGELMSGASLNGAACGKTLICLFQRGAADALNVVVPHGEASYYNLRPRIAIPRPNGGLTGAIDLDGFFGLHPAL